MRKLFVLFVIGIAPLFFLGCEDSPWVIMTYNVLNGAGVDALSEVNRANVEHHGYHGNRLERVIEVVQEANPDILAIEEAHQWNEGDPSTMETFSEETGMHYSFFFESANVHAGRPSAALFSRFPIIEPENFGDRFSRAGGHAIVLGPGNERIHVFVLHLDTNSSAKRQQELSFVSGELSDHLEHTVILLGDLNFVDNGTCAESVILNEAGMRHPLRDMQGIDQVWVTEHMEQSVEPGSDIPAELTEGTSDHDPLVVEM